MALGAYLGDDGLRNGIRVRVSSYARPAINTVMAKAKIAGNYINSFLAKREAIATGYQEAVMLDTQGYVSEATGENIFVIKRGQVYTPPLGCAVLAGITRDTVITLCADLGLQVTERLISRDELYIATRCFSLAPRPKSLPCARSIIARSQWQPRHHHGTDSRAIFPGSSRLSEGAFRVAGDCVKT